MREILRKKYIPMTETIYYTLLSVVTPRHGYAIMQHVSSLTKGRILLGTGTLYTMVGRLTSDGMIRVLPDSEKKTYQITDIGLELLWEETRRLELQLEDGRKILSGGGCFRFWMWKAGRRRQNDFNIYAFGSVLTGKGPDAGKA